LKLDRFSVRARYLFPFSLGAGLLGVFILPFLFPPSRPIPSQSYVAGYNNRVALVSVILISILVALLSLRENWLTPAKFGDEPSVSRRWLIGALMLVAAWNGGLSWLVFEARNYAVEDFYFLPQLEKFYYRHLHLYRDLEFPYGQLLFYPPLWIHSLLAPFHTSLRASYYIALMFHHFLGVGMLYFVVNRLPIPRAVRTAAFASITMFSVTPPLGPNYALLRYMLGIISFLLFSRIERPAAAAGAAALAEILMWLDSPEEAFALGFAIAVYCCYRVWRQRTLLWLGPIAGTACGAALYLVSVDPAVLSALKHMSGGSNNLVPQISLEVVTLLIATVWLVPRLVARHICRDTAEAPMLLGLYALGLGLLPASLGCSDIVHITGNSAVLFLLSLVAVGECKLPVRWLWTTTVTTTYLLMAARWCFDASPRFYPDILPAFERKLPSVGQPLDVAALHAAIGDAPFATPFPMPEVLEEQLPQLPDFAPSYWSGTIALWDDEAEQKKIAELRRVQWALLPPGFPHLDQISPNLDELLSVSTHYRALHVVYSHALLNNEIAENWTPVGYIGNYVLFRRIR
jgi:hypothetical protein